MSQASARPQRSVLITGCSSGIGEACALGLHARGWRVFATARQAADVTRLAAQGLETLHLDVTDSASIQAAVQTVLERTEGRLDALFNNAGYGQPGAVEDLSRAVLQAQFDTNLFGPLELTNRVIPIMRQQGHGRIVFNSSLLGYFAMSYRGAYNASKFAMEGLVDTLRLELAQTPIRVSLIEPGPVLSRFRPNALAQLERHIDIPNSVHRASYEGVLARLKKPGPAAPFTLPPTAVLDKLIHALESPRPWRRYPVTVPAHAFWWARRLLPGWMLDRISLRTTASENRA